MKTRALYGFTPDLAPFAGQTPEEQVALLRSWGSTAIFGGYENAEFVAAAKDAGLKVYAEFGCFVHKRWWDEFPESRPLTDGGVPLEPDEWYYGVNPSTPVVRRKLLEALERLLEKHAVDGVWLDFIRWPCHWESPTPYFPRTSFDKPTLDRFGADTGVELATHDPVAAAQQLLSQFEKEWTAWRCEQITSWVADAKRLIERVHPDALLGLFGVPWRLSDYDAAILDVIGQDYRALGSYVDVFSPMVYHVMCGRPVAWIGQVIQHVKALSGKPVWPIIQSVDEPKPLAAEEYGRALDVALSHPSSDGVLVFTLKGALDEGKLEITRARFA
jgi:hypothetical protein